MTFRLGCALFIDGICVHSGSLSNARCDQIAADERKAIADEDTDRLPPPTPEGEQLLRKLFDDH